MSTPTKAAEIIREALETSMARIGCPPGDNADADIYHQLDRALSLLADLDGGVEVVAWMRKAGVGRSEYVHPEAKKNCPECWSEYTIPLYIHPSPTAADAPPDPDAHITDQEQYLKAKQERAKDVDFDGA